MTVFDKLNLKPGERRVVIFVALLVFVVLNAWFVWPKFFQWGKLQSRKKQAETSLQQFQREVDRIPQYERRLRELEQQGASVGSEDQASKLQTTVYSQAALSGVQVNNYIPQKASTGGKTNAFFDETVAVIQFVAEEKNLVDFLFNLGAGGSLIRVRNMAINPDPARQRLQGSIALVASFARRAPARPGATPAASPAASATTPRPGVPGAAPRSITTAMKPATNTPPPPKASWWSRLWPFGNKPASPVVKTNAPARTNAPGTGPKK